LLIAARIVSGLAAGFVTGTATAALAEPQPRGDRQAAAVTATGSNMTGLGLGPLIAGLFAEYVALPTRGVFCTLTTSGDRPRGCREGPSSLPVADVKAVQ
jgi:MFS family permease